MMLKRLFDIFFSLTALFLLAPLFLIIAVIIKLDSTGPVFFRQDRVGKKGKLFRIHKFRTMTTSSEEKGLQITVGKDPRITRSGAFLRKYKLDELPQLLDVVLGKMSLVGPRPEVPHYVEYYPDEIRKQVLSVRPGITDLASIEFKSENEILARSDDPQRSYVEDILPIKLQYYMDYVKSRSFKSDVRILLDTLIAVFIKK